MSLLFAGIRAASLLGVLFSIAADRVGRRKPLLGAFALMALGSMLTAFIPTVPVFVASQALVRISIVAIASISIVLIAEEVAPGVRALSIGFYGLAGLSRSWARASPSPDC